MQTVVRSTRPTMVGQMHMVRDVWRVLRLLRYVFVSLVAYENADKKLFLSARQENDCSKGLVPRNTGTISIITPVL